MSKKGNVSFRPSKLGVAYRKTGHAKFKGDGQGWKETEISDTLNIFDNSETRTPILIIQKDTDDERDMESPGEPSAGQ